MLRQDIRGVHQGRGSAGPIDNKGRLDGDVKQTSNNSESKSAYNCRLDNLSIDFNTTNQGIVVNRVTY